MTKQDAEEIVEAMATDYRQAQAALAAARSGLIAAISDAKVHKSTTAELVKLSGWSPAQIKNIAAYSAATRETSTSQSSGQSVSEAATECPTEDTDQPAAATTYTEGTTDHAEI